MSNYLIIIIGWLLGQAAYACKKSWDIQKKSVSISFPQALHMFFKKETAAFAFGSIMLLIAMFILSDFINLDIKKEELKNIEAAQWKKYLVNFLRTASVFFGYLCQNIGYFAFGKSEKYLQKKADDENIELPR